MKLDLNFVMRWIWFLFGVYLLLYKKELAAGLICFVLSDIRAVMK